MHTEPRTGAPSRAAASSGLAGLWLTVTQFLREQWFAAQCCRQWRSRLESVRRDRPDLRGPELYALVLQRHLGLDPAQAAHLVDLADESYAQWPSPRPVNFRDVVHYLAATHLTGRHGTVGSDIRPVINRHLPSQW